MPFSHEKPLSPALLEGVKSARGFASPEAPAQDMKIRSSGFRVSFQPTSMDWARDWSRCAMGVDQKTPGLKPCLNSWKPLQGWRRRTSRLPADLPRLRREI